jgi:hypothetical protein
MQFYATEGKKCGGGCSHFTFSSGECMMIAFLDLFAVFEASE